MGRAMLKGVPIRVRLRCISDTISIMVSAIRQIVTVSPNGTLEIHAPELAPGVRAEVIILLGTTDSQMADPAQTPLMVWEALQKSLAISAPIAEKWSQDVRIQRRMFGTSE